MYGMQPGDGVRVKKKFLGLLHHYVIYLGIYQSGHLFIANTESGVKILSEGQLREYLQYLEPREIKYFKGSRQQRELAVQRALQYPNRNSYRLLANNCEHFFNYVQKGVRYSRQAEVFGASLAATGTIMTVRNLLKDPEEDENADLKAIGGMLLAGLGLWAMSNANQDE